MSNNLKDIGWIKRALCVTNGDDIRKYFQSFDPEDIQKAKGICFMCPVKLQCNKAYGDEALYVVAGETRYERLMRRWHRIESPDEDNFQ